MKKLLPVFLFAILIAPLIANAVGIDPQSAICNILDKIKIIIAALGFGIGVIMLIWGGIMYMTAGGDPEKAGKARGLIINAIIGIAIVFAATFILNVVEGFLSGAGVTINPFGSACGL